jgi:hypothetical protein
VIIDGEEWIPPDELDKHWRDFLVAMMANSVRLCRWISAKSRKGVRQSWKAGPSERFYSAAIAWRWVFWGPNCGLSLEEVCEFLGLDAQDVRLKILADCQPARDINQVVDRVIRAGDLWCAKPKRKGPRPVTPVSVDWRKLRESRGHIPGVIAR